MSGRGILYATNYDEAKAFAHVTLIHDTPAEIFKRAEATGQPTSEAADHLAEERFLGKRPEHAEAAA